MLVVKVDGINLLIIPPANNAIAKIVEQTTLIIIADLKGILILLVPQAKLATKASMDRALTSKIASIEDKKLNEENIDNPLTFDSVLTIYE